MGSTTVSPPRCAPIACLANVSLSATSLAVCLAAARFAGSVQSGSVGGTANSEFGGQLPRRGSEILPGKLGSVERCDHVGETHRIENM